MSPDLQDLLETSFGDGPAHRPIDERLVAGRRALHRRRIVTTGATAAAVAALALTPLAAGRLHGSLEPVPVNGPRSPPSTCPPRRLRKSTPQASPCSSCTALSTAATAG